MPILFLVSLILKTFTSCSCLANSALGRILSGGPLFPSRVCLSFFLSLLWWPLFQLAQILIEVVTLYVLDSLMRATFDLALLRIGSSIALNGGRADPKPTTANLCLRCKRIKLLAIFSLGNLCAMSPPPQSACRAINPRLHLRPFQHARGNPFITRRVADKTLYDESLLAALVIPFGRVLSATYTIQARLKRFFYRLFKPHRCRRSSLPRSIGMSRGKLSLSPRQSTRVGVNRRPWVRRGNIFLVHVSPAPRRVLTRQQNSIPVRIKDVCLQPESFERIQNSPPIRVFGCNRFRRLFSERILKGQPARRQT